MGNVFKKLFGGGKEKRILMVGLDAAGKTTMLYKLNLADPVITLPTIGFTVETIKYKSLSLTCWDVGGRDKLRLLWRHYYKNTDGIIFVVDSNDRDRIGGTNRGKDEDYGSAKYELWKMLEEEELQNAALLVFANKQDLPNPLTVNEVSGRLGLDDIQGRKWHIQATCATTGDGLYEGLEWLSNTLKV